MTNQTSHPAGGGDPKPGVESAPEADMRSLLTREEIEALLGANRSAGAGIGALIDSPPQPYERLPLLQPVLERLAERLPRALGTFAGVRVEAVSETPATVRLGEYLDNLPLPALLAVWRADAWGGGGLVAMDGALTEALLDVLLGGRRFSGAARGGRGTYTPIERAVAGRAIGAILAELGAAFLPVTPVELRLERLETDTRLAAIAPSRSGAALARFAVTLDKRGGRLEIALPYATLEPVAALMGRDHVGGTRRDPRWKTRLAGEMGAAEVRIDAVLDRVTMKLRDVLGWKAGSRIALNSAPGADVELSSGGVKLLQGKLGRAGDRLAVRVERWLLRRHERD